MASNWIKGFNCYGCGSTLGRRAWNRQTQKADVMCFVCCVGQYELLESEIEGEDYEQILKLCGREPGNVEQILPRINSPYCFESQVDASPMYLRDVASEGPLNVSLNVIEYSEFSRGHASLIERLALIPAFQNAKLKKDKK